jgi:glycosyltransferase involved in cell wall biosynthesis
MRILALPREDGNPYQELLYRELRRQNAEVTYIGLLTPSHTLNQLLLPAELIVGRLAGARLVHLHWVYKFALIRGGRFPVLRRVAQLWFGLWLWMLRMLDLRLVWTAHNVLPLQQVFFDDLRARRQLVKQCDLVIAHSMATLERLATLDMVPKKAVVIPLGPYTPVDDSKLVYDPNHDGPRRLLFFGNVREYKGIEELLVAFAALSPDLAVKLTIAGQCNEPALRQVITELAEHSSERVELRLEHIPDNELTHLLAESDVAVLPFRRSTTSSSAMLALGHGLPIILPNLPGLAELPDEAVFRYDGTVEGLATVLAEVILAAPSRLAQMSAAADAYCASLSWDKIGEQTLAAFGAVHNADIG